MDTLVAWIPVDEILDRVRAGETRGPVGDYRGVKLAKSVRLLVFATKGTTCVSCGIKATHFDLVRGLERQPHLQLSAGDILMTKDHIKPRSKGGSEWLKNLQPMCYPCNSAKGDSV